MSVASGDDPQLLGRMHSMSVNKSNFLSDPAHRGSGHSSSGSGGTAWRGGSSFHAGSQEDIFRSFAGTGENSRNVSKREFMAAMEKAGLLRDDPRLQESFALVDRAPEHMSFEQFNGCITPNISLIDRAFQNDFVIPNWPAFAGSLDAMFDEVGENKEGHVANYIPQLARVDPEQYGASVCSVDGQRWERGSARTMFCIQSCCKPLTYALALEDWGEDKVHEHVGREPSGRGFNELVLNQAGRPHNPLINAGAIMSCALVKPQLTMADRFDYVRGMVSKLGGGEKVGFSNATYLSERQTADRNFALGYYMREKKAFPEGTDLRETLEFYFQVCSMEITCKTGSIVAATLANGGICPVTGERLIKARTVRNVLSMMYSCGMYDYSGEFAFSMGLPAKSGVAGAVITVVPNVLGICTWSPRLDHMGNSVRGVEFVRRLVQRYNFHNYDNLVLLRGSRKVDPRKKKTVNADNSLVSLIFAAANGDLSAVRRLFLAGNDLNAADYDGRTAMHLAAAEGHAHVVKFLVETGHLINPVDRWDATPLDDAIRAGHTACIDYLQAAGASPFAATLES